MKAEEEIYKEIENQISMHGKDNVRVIAQNIAQFVADSYEVEQQFASLDSLIERLKNESQYDADGDKKIKTSKAIEILRTTSCIKKTAVRQKGTGKWYYVSMDINRGWLTQSEFALVDEFWLDSESLPSDAELIDIEILIP